MRNKVKNILYISIILLLVVLSFGTGFFFNKMSMLAKNTDTNRDIQTAMEDTSSKYAVSDIAVPIADTTYTQDELQNIRVYEKTKASVVNISTEVMSMNWFFEPIPTEGSTGSGAIIDASGYVLTNTHVIDKAVKIYVSLSNGDQYEAEVVGTDTENDLAVLKFNPSPGVTLEPIPFGSSANLKVGQKVLAIGNPFGLDRTLTVGVVSALGRPIRNDNDFIINNMIQTDTAINPGNSGGPLLDSSGLLIGINTMIYSTSGSSAGVGFAVPVDTAKRIIPELIKNGKVTRGTIDAQLVQMNSSIANYAKLNINYGLLVSSVDKNSNAQQAGLYGGTQQVRYGYGRNASSFYIGGDIIVAINGQAIKQFSDYYSALEDKKPNETVTVTVIRNGKEVQLKIKLVARS
ncbi:MAG: trypsin-like peptidase domain-containing protein [Spirochaetaceae bacterium]|nr:trypsin-like peptidase domain-containing protein [Spirochaetaceae bacterium]